jgi:chromosome segregation ATPase
LKKKDLDNTCKNRDLKIKSFVAEKDRVLADLKELHEIEIKTLNKKMIEIVAKNEKDTMALNTEIEDLNAKMNDLNTQLFLKNNKISKIVVDMNKQEIFFQKVNEELCHAKNHIRELTNKLGDITSENSTLNVELLEKDKNLNSLVNERDEISAEIEKLNSALIHKQNENLSMKHKLSALETRIKELNDLVKDKEAESEAKIKKLNASFQQLIKERDEIKQKCQRLSQVGASFLFIFWIGIFYF